MVLRSYGFALSGGHMLEWAVVVLSAILYCPVFLSSKAPTRLLRLTDLAGAWLSVWGTAESVCAGAIIDPLQTLWKLCAQSLLCLGLHLV